MKVVTAVLVILLLLIIQVAGYEQTCKCSRKNCCREQKEKMMKMKFRATGLLEYNLDEFYNRTDTLQGMPDFIKCLSQQTDTEKCLDLTSRARFRRQDQSACKTQNKIVVITEVTCISNCNGVTRVPVLKDDFGQYPYFFTPVCQSVNSSCGCGISASKCRNKMESHGVMARVPMSTGVTLNVFIDVELAVMCQCT
ncbi:uncharacterized protein LOC127871563 [Dreissena polymorpha]|uniref:Uncharacterized protein n=1 Tax=Dreissena polymorpha TaxID=45954 RepID=A0A9D4LGG3_DREPO|nr:uncharacterized protein LOC127871563 [Dreissena polymorpha]XP_052270582.1 uncharacterized protein LOC127871563 [Dreissena polymorpha]KAH3858113.1 hypothetical protein DPMN_100732 [Dreissena polymorpha]